MRLNFLDFEQPVAELDAKIDELQQLDATAGLDISAEIARLRSKREELIKHTFSHLSDWQVAQLARHPARPYLQDYLPYLFTEFDELHGDRVYADDKAIIGGMAYFYDRPVMVVGHQKGRDTKEKVQRNFGMANPEGYRKAKRLFEMAERFRLPVLTFIDTSGAYPGIEAEERGQNEAIAHNLQIMAQLKTPIICTITGEGCSGGALGIGVGDRLLMLQYSTYSVISPEGCASILWKSAEKAPVAAEAMNMTATKLHALGLVDDIVPEPLGGAHRDLSQMAATLRAALRSQLEKLVTLSTEQLLEARYRRLMQVSV